MTTQASGQSANEAFDINRVRAEIEAEAEERRRADPELARLERDIKWAWAAVAPYGATGDENELFLDRADRLASLDAFVPIGSRRGARQIKWAVRKATYWYIRSIVDQFNAFAGVVARLLRRLDGRIDKLEDAVGLLSDDDSALFDGPVEPSPETANAVAALAGSRRCLVLSCGEGTIVSAIKDRRGDAYGVERASVRVLAGTRRGLDLRTGDVPKHLMQLPDSSLGAIVFAGTVETLPLATLWQLVNESARVLDSTGRIVVAVADPALRSGVEAEVRAGRGIAPATWRHLLERAGYATRLDPSPGPRITQLVTAERT